MRILGILLCTLALVFTAGCQNYMESSERRTAGEFTDDLAIQARVKSRLLGDPEISGLRVNVEVDRGIVGLFGRVETDEQRIRAVTLTSEVPGVKKVEDRLLVMP